MTVGEQGRDCSICNCESDAAFSKCSSNWLLIKQMGVSVLLVPGSVCCALNNDIFFNASKGEDSLEIQV